MADWVVWFSLAGALIILDMFIGTFYLLMIGLGLAAGGVAAFAGGDVTLQLLVAAIIGIAAVQMLRRSRAGKLHDSDASRDPNVNLDIGQTLNVETWNETDGIFTARAGYRGASWDVELARGAEARSGLFVIREVRGNRLIVDNSETRE